MKRERALTSNRSIFLRLRSAVLSAILITTTCASLVPLPSARAEETPEIVALVETKSSCPDKLRPAFPYSDGWIRLAAEVVGFGVGISNDVFITLTRNEVHLLPPEVARWTIFFNEFANILATSTGKPWIYSGARKRIIDNAALGVLIGGSLRLAATDGLLVGALGFGASYGLTFWFPNRYFHGLMEGIPKRLPKALSTALDTGVGKAVIGISMIVVIEMILEHAIEIARWLPANIPGVDREKKKDRAPASDGAAARLDLSTAFWLVSLENILGGPLDSSKGARLGALLSGKPVELEVTERVSITRKLEAAGTKAWSNPETLKMLRQSLGN